MSQHVMDREVKEQVLAAMKVASRNLSLARMALAYVEEPCDASPNQALRMAISTLEENLRVILLEVMSLPATA